MIGFSWFLGTLTEGGTEERRRVRGLAGAWESNQVGVAKVGPLACRSDREKWGACSTVAPLGRASLTDRAQSARRKPQHRKLIFLVFLLLFLL